ncbi:TPA: gluconate 5-dehydrogenase [Yersinia enterocolitica]|nr:gluconate 5-dehydrogenase [Yersinia enterocolitica]EKN6306356.1 gluconate 5-dehydrogenase [Yersinia enterocolitica]
MDVLTASLRSTCFHRCGHFVNSLKASTDAFYLLA